MEWHKVTFIQGEPPMGRPLQLTNLARAKHLAINQPPGFAVFMTFDEENCNVLYFSPVASQVCSELLAEWDGIACESPINKLIFSSPAYGSL